MLVDADVPDVAQQGEVDDASFVLLVVCHEFVEAVVFFAFEGEVAVVLPYELDRLAQLVLREAAFHDTQVEFADESPRHSIAVQYGATLFHSQTLEGVTCGVTQVERLAQPFLRRVFLHDALLHGNTLCHQCAKLSVVCCLLSVV